MSSVFLCLASTNTSLFAVLLAFLSLYSELLIQTNPIWAQTSAFELFEQNFKLPISYPYTFDDAYIFRLRISK